MRKNAVLCYRRFGNGMILVLMSLWSEVRRGAHPPFRIAADPSYRFDR